MRNDDDRDAGFAVDVADEFQDGSGRFRIQRAGGFIAQQHVRVRSQRPRDRDALLLTAGELGGIGFGFIGKADRCEQRQGFLLCLRFFHTGQAQRQHDIVQAVFLHQQIERLENHRNLAPCRTQLLFSEA